MIAKDARQDVDGILKPWFSQIGIIAFLVAIAMVSNDSSAQSPKSHTRFIRTEDAKVYCGPSESLYATTVLKQGEAVEIYHITDDGWAGIRPPESSFDWLEAEHAYLLPGGKLAEVVGKPIPCWIGSSVESPTKYRWQIELQPTQQVRVIGEARQVIDNGTERLWYKIAPPPGEFRWLRLVELDKQPVATADTSSLKGNSRRGGANAELQESQTEAVRTAQFLADGEWIVEDTFDEETLPSPTSIKQSQPGPIVLGEGSFDDDVLIGEGCDECGSAPCCCHRCFLSRFGLPCGCRTNPNEGMVVQRLNGILGLVGFGVARLPVDPSPVEPGVFRTKLEPVPSRLDHLPRPGGRTRLRYLRSPFPRDGYFPMFSAQSGEDSDPSWSAKSLASSNTAEVGTGLAHASPQHPRMPDFTLFAASLGTNYPHGSPPEPSWHGIPTIDAPPSGNRPGFVEPLREVPRSPTIDRMDGVVPAASWTSTASSIPSRIPLDDATTLELTTPTLQQGLVELSMIVAKPVEQWDMSRVKELSLRSIEYGTSAVERGEARLLLQRVEQFESMRNRTLGSVPQLASSAAPTSMAAANTDIRSVPAADGDASGWLVQIHKTLPNQPEFALTDLAGNVIAYVDPAPGVNLRRFNREAVVVYGSRGYLPALAARHITAERVVRIR